MLILYYVYISGIIGHHKKIETTHSSTHPNKQCNCKGKETCPLLGNCLQKNVVYIATAKTNSSVKQYIGATEDTIKQRIYKHKLSFTHRNYWTNISLSTHNWHLKDMNILPTTTREILKLAPASPIFKKFSHQFFFFPYLKRGFWWLNA